MTKKVLKFLLIFLIFYLIAIFLYNITPPVINSNIGTLSDVSNYISNLEKQEKIKIVITESDYAKNEMTYKIYSKDKFDLNKLEYLTPLSTFIIDYDDNDIIENIEYTFNLNFKGYNEILEMLIRSTLIDLTDKGYTVVSKCLKLNELDTKKEEYKSRKFVSSAKEFNLEYNNEKHQFIFKIK